MSVPLQAWLLLAAALFGTGMIGLFTRRNAIAMLLSVELMANAVNINFVALGFARGDYAGQVMALFGVALTVAEVIAGLAIVILLHRKAKTIDVDQVGELSG